MDGVITIRKSLLGYIYRIFWALAVVAVLVFFLAVASNFGRDPLPAVLVPAIGIFLVLVALILLASLYLYSLNYIRLDETGVSAQQWLTFFSDTNAETEWHEITSVDSEQHGVLARIFGYGTLLIQQAGTQQPIYMTMCPRVDHWKDYIQDRASHSPQPVRVQQ